jgi:hypothetical protein
LDVRLLDSNGKGGYHILIVHETLIPMAVSWRLGKYLVRDHGRFGLSKPPETFPKSPHLTGKGYGPWIRLAGRHHKRAHWTRVWSPKRQLWRDGEAAVKSLLKLRGRPVDPATIMPSDFDPETRRSRIIHPAQLVDEAPIVGWRHGHDVLMACDALSHLGDEYRNDYQEWLRVGMALRQLGPDGFALWDAWSRPSPKYEAGATTAKWASMAPGTASGGVTLGTLFMLASKEGWNGFHTETTLPEGTPAVIRDAFARVVAGMSRGKVRRQTKGV